MVPPSSGARGGAIKGLATPSVARSSHRGEQRIDLRHHLEGVRHIQHVGFAARPSTVRIEINGAPFANEAPADGVRLFAVTAGGQAFGMARRGTGLADLVEMGHELQDGFAFAAQIHQRLTAA